MITHGSQRVKCIIMFIYYMAGFVSGQDEANHVLIGYLSGRWMMGLGLLRIARFVPAKAKFFGAMFWPYNKSFID